MGYEQFYWDQIKSRVNRINSQFSEKDPLSFLRLVVSLVTGASSGEIDEFITEGGDDLGADAIQIEVNDEEKRFKIFIIQTKYNKESCAKGIFNKNIEQSVIDKFKIFLYSSIIPTRFSFRSVDISILTVVSCMLHCPVCQVPQCLVCYTVRCVKANRLVLMRRHTGLCVRPASGTHSTNFAFVCSFREFASEGSAARSAVIMIHWP